MKYVDTVIRAAMTGGCLITLLSCTSNNVKEINHYGDRVTEDPASVVRSDYLGTFGLAPDLQITPEKEHEALQTLYKLDHAIQADTALDELIDVYYTNKDAEALRASKGWYRYPYIAPIMALESGRCEQLSWRPHGSKKIEINCIGTYLLQSPVLGPSIEKMRLKFKMKKEADQWYLEKGGLAYTQAFGFPEVNTGVAVLGLKFKHEL